MTIKALAARCDIPAARMSRYLRDLQPFPPGVLGRVAEAFGMTVPALVDHARDLAHGAALHVDPFGAFDGTPHELETALWPLGIRLRAKEDLRNEDIDGRRVLGTVSWWPDQSEVIVTPDARATDQEQIKVLRSAERMLLGADEPSRFNTPHQRDDGDRYLSFRFMDGGR